MMDIRVMGMRVRDWHVTVRMCVRFLPVVRKGVLMLMMFIVPVCVIVFERLVRVRMLVTLADMKPDAQRHQRGRDPEQRRRHARPDCERKRHAE